MKVKIYYRKKTQITVLKAQVKSVCTTLKHCKILMKVKISCLLQRLQRTREINANFDKVLKCFSIVKRVSKVIFLNQKTLKEIELCIDAFVAGTSHQVERIKRIMKSKPDSQQ